MLIVPLLIHAFCLPLKVIFLDEPTSGLDSRGALVVMRAMKRIADTGRTVCSTVHQPSGVRVFLSVRKVGFEVFSLVLLLMTHLNLATVGCFSDV